MPRSQFKVTKPNNVQTKMSHNIRKKDRTNIKLGDIMEHVKCHK